MAFFSRSLLLFTLPLLLLLSSCSFVAQKVSREEDATLAFKLAAPDVDSFKYSDLSTLRKMLEDFTSKYHIGLAYLKKAGDLYEGTEGLVHAKRLVEVEMGLNNLEALTKNLSIVYPDQWEEEKSKLREDLHKLQELYQTAYNKLI